MEKFPISIVFYDSDLRSISIMIFNGLIKKKKTRKMNIRREGCVGHEIVTLLISWIFCLIWSLILHLQPLYQISYVIMLLMDTVGALMSFMSFIW